MIKALSVAMPPKSILDPTFPYVPAHKTNLAETFRRAREEQRKALIIHVVFNNPKATS